MNKILFLLLVISSVLLADGDHWVYTYGDTTILKAVYNYLALLKEDSNYSTLLSIAILVGIVLTVIMKKMNPSASFINYTGTIVLITGLFATTATVHVMNVKTYNSLNVNDTNYASIDNVPYLFGFLTSSFSIIGYVSARTIEDTLHVAGDLENEYRSTSFLNSGMNGSFKLYEGLNRINFASIGPEANELVNIFKSYNELCINEIAYPLNRDEVYTILVNSKNLLDDINPEGTHSVINVVKNQMVSTKFGTITCGDLWKKGEEYRDSLLASTDIPDAIQDRFKQFTGDALQATAAVTKLYAGTEGNNPEERLKNYMLANAYMQAFNAPWSASIQQGAFGAGLSIAQIQQMGQVNAQTASVMIPAMHSIMQTMIYISFPIILLIMIASGDWKLISIYTKTLLWIELWVPNFSILNFYIQRDASTQATDKMIAAANGFSTDNPLTLINLANQAEIYSTIATQGAVAANMLWSVPMLAGFMMFGSFHSLMGVGGSIMRTASAQGQIDNQMEQKNLAAAADRINKGIAEGNPMHTGDIGNALGNAAQIKHTDTLAALAAVEKLGAGNMDRGMDNFANTKMGKATEKIFEDTAHIKTLDNNLISAATAGGQWSALDSMAKQKTMDMIGQDGIASSKFMEYSKSAYDNIEYKNKLGDVAQTYSGTIGDMNNDGKTNWADAAQYLATGGADKNIISDLASSNFALNQADQKQFDATKTQLQEDMGKSQATMNIANKYFGGVENMANSMTNFDLAQKSGNQEQMQAIADSATGKTGTDSIREFQMMQSATGVSYTKDGWTYKDSYDTNGNLVNRNATQTRENGVVTVDYDPKGNEVNYTRMNGVKVDESKTWDVSYHVKGAQESLLRDQQEARNLNEDQKREIMFAKAVADETKLTLDGAKSLANNLIAGINTEIRNWFK